MVVDMSDFGSEVEMKTMLEQLSSNPGVATSTKTKMYLLHGIKRLLQPMDISYHLILVYFYNFY